MSDIIERMQHDQTRLIKQILWHYRHIDPNLAVTITDKDIEALDQCLEHNKQVSQITLVTRPNHLVVVMTDTQGNAVAPVENNIDDFEKGEQARRRKRVLETIGELANRVRNQAAAGDFSSSEVIELADAALLLAK